MDFGEKLFSKLWMLKHPKRSEHDTDINCVNLTDLHERLTFLARALTKSPIFIHPSQEEGGWYKNNFYLPETFKRYSSLERNVDYYYFRCIFLCFAFLGSRRGRQPDFDKEGSRKFCFELSEFIIPKIHQEFPPFSKRLDLLITAEREINLSPQSWHWLWGRWLAPPVEAKDSFKKDYKLGEEKESIDQEITTELDGFLRDEVEVLNLDKKSQEDYTLNHNFEKCLTAEDFNGNWRDFNGEDELEEHQDALEEVSMSHVIRVPDPVHSVARSRLRLNALLPEESVSQKKGGIKVKEWDYRKGIYRTNYCQVYITVADTIVPGSAQKILNSEFHLYQALLKKYRLILNERDLVRRVPYGELLDLDAMVDSFAEVRAGNAMPENIYSSKRKTRLSVSVSFLVDLSLSTDAYVENERILDLEKRTLTIFGEVLHDLDIDFSIHSFFSETRNNCTLQTVKEFSHKWYNTQDIIASLMPTGYTRMGPALRVLSSKLSDQTERKDKFIIFITDGKPTDYDLYEGTYGINDVRMAIKESRSVGVKCCGLALDSDARQYFPVMMGEEAYEILNSPKEITTCLTKLFTKVFTK